MWIIELLNSIYTYILYFCKMKHSKSNGVKQQSFNHNHRLCGLGTWKGHQGDLLSVLHDVWGLSWKEPERLGLTHWLRLPSPECLYTHLSLMSGADAGTQAGGSAGHLHGCLGFLTAWWLIPGVRTRLKLYCPSWPSLGSQMLSADVTGPHRFKGRARGHPPQRN